MPVVCRAAAGEGGHAGIEARAGELNNSPQILGVLTDESYWESCKLRADLFFRFWRIVKMEFDRKFLAATSMIVGMCFVGERAGEYLRHSPQPATQSILATVTAGSTVSISDGPLFNTTTFAPLPLPSASPDEQLKAAVRST